MIQTHNKDDKLYMSRKKFMVGKENESNEEK
jgi:hypothetical protein